MYTRVHINLFSIMIDIVYRLSSNLTRFISNLWRSSLRRSCSFSAIIVDRMLSFVVNVNTFVRISALVYIYWLHNIHIAYDS